MQTAFEPNSLIASLASLTPAQREQVLMELSPNELLHLRHDWSVWARDKQRPPSWAWRTWLILAGRGFGKTRTGAEMVRQWAKEFPLVNLIGATADDARDIMIEGESGILAVCRPDERPTYRASRRQLEWPNGAKSLIFTADEPERLRGKQHMKLWADELGAWRYAESWDQAMMGLRR
jgi:phage terminase large subunit-like protein